MADSRQEHQMEQGSTAQGQQGDKDEEGSPLLGGLKRAGRLFWTPDEDKPSVAAPAARNNPLPMAAVHQFVPAPAVVDPEAVKAIERQLGTLATPGLAKLRELLDQLAALDEANRFKAVQALLGGQGITRATLLGEVDQINGKIQDIGAAFERNLGQRVADAKQAVESQTATLNQRIAGINQQIEALNAQAVELEGQRDVAERGVTRAEEESATKRAGFTPALEQVANDHASLRALITRYLTT